MTPRQLPGQPTARSVGSFALCFLVLFGAIARTSDASEGAPETIAWRSEYNSAYFEAKDGKRLIWLQFTGPWCPNCRKMERESFPQAKIVERTRESFVPVKLRSDTNEDLAVQFNLTGLPATVIIDPSNQAILALHQGYLGPDDLDAIFADAVSRRDRERTIAKARLASTSSTSKANAKKPAKGREQSENSQPTTASNSNPTPKPQPASPKSKTLLALSGYCPVSLVTTHKLVPGLTAHSVEFEGKTYRFASLEMETMFRANPEKFLPVNQGLCPVAEVDREQPLAGHPRFGVLYRDRLYLCATVADRRLFLKNPERYAAAHVEEKGYCPHCARSEGLLVKGDPRFGLVRSGREYWFPDEDHRSAFLASLPQDNKSTR
jgi:YHS domain-containing protein/thiol-disulfide isomerase/thioredoxin